MLMNENFTAELFRICDQLSGRTLPRWRELPDLELYMDQVLALIARYLGETPGEKGLTASMVNNYVKLGIMPPPVKKKYARTHLAYLMVICVLKPVLPLPSIRDLVLRELETLTEEVFYNNFCDLFENTDAAVAESARHFSRADGGLTLSSVFAPALRAQAEQALALQLIAASFPQETK